MKIAIFTDSYLPHRNGVSYSIKRQVAILESKGHEVSIVGPSYLDVDIKIKSKVIFHTKDKNYQFSIPFATVKQISDKINPDIVYIHTPFSIGLLAINFAKKLYIPIICTHHTNFSHYYHYLPYFNNYFGKFVLHSLCSAFLSKAHIVISPSECSKRNLIAEYKICQEKVEVLPTPINDDMFVFKNVSAEKRFDLILVGRLSKEKNICLIQEALKSIIHAIPNIKIAIIGRGMDEKKFMSVFEKYIGKNIIPLGELDNREVLEHINLSRFLLFPSISETQGLVLQEAWVNNVPVIAVECELTNEIIVDGQNGWCTPNTPVDFAQKTIQLINKARCTKSMQDVNCKVNLERFSTSIWYESFCRIFMNEVC